MTFTESVKTCFSKYADFTGRASRSEFWWFYLFQAIITLPLCLLSNIITYMSDYTEAISPLLIIVAILMIVVGLGLLLPSLAVAWRRLHDTGKSGAWIFISLIPMIGSIILLVFYCTASDPYPNQYGDPEEY